MISHSFFIRFDLSFVFFDDFSLIWRITQRAGRQCRETVLSQPRVPRDSFVTTALAERHCCHYRACREAVLSLPSLTGGIFVTAELAERKFCHYQVCREVVLSLPSLPRGSFVNTACRGAVLSLSRLPRGVLSIPREESRH
jgi:hypothetical protein